MSAVHDHVLCPYFVTRRTNRFYRIDLDESKVNADRDFKGYDNLFDVILKVNCPYSEAIAKSAVQRRPWCSTHEDNIVSKTEALKIPMQVGDFENIDWEDVMKGKCLASSYLVRKGLSRKAQLATQIKRYVSKHRDSILSKATPYTLVLQTWDAFEDMKVDFGGGTFASFDTSAVMNVPLRQRLEWCLEDTKLAMEKKQTEDGVSHWILKSSVTNKGADIVIVRDWDGLLDALEDVPDIREWVLQEYIAKPLLISKHKFHLRVYVLCVGCLKVFVFEQVLILIAAHRYKLDDIDDIYRHLSNTARSAEDINFDEEKFVKILDDLPLFLHRERSDIAPSPAAAEEAVRTIRKQINEITAELFAAFENEYTVFAPMSNCFELFGLDFMIDDALNVSLLEVNPGPDFKQTGDRLRAVIVQLWEQTLKIVIDSEVHIVAQSESGSKTKNDRGNNNNNQSVSSSNLLSKGFSCGDISVGQHAADDFVCVYSKEWSAAQMQGGMSFT